MRLRRVLSCMSGRARFRRIKQRGRRLVAAGLGPVIGMALAPAVPVVVAAVAAAPAKAANGPSVLVLVQNGESAAPEAAVLQNAGYQVTQVTPATWLGMSAAQFEGYAALVIGDPSAGGSCSSLTPTTGTTGTDAIGATWQQAVSGNVAVLGTAPALPGTTAANTLITDSAGYAAAGFNSAKSGTATSGTGLYVSLNCEYSTAAAGTSVPLLDGVEGIGTAGGLQVRGNLACVDPGTVNQLEAGRAGTFGGFTSGQLSISSWGAGCPVDEAFTRWPAMFTAVGYDAASDATANFTASNGTAGQPYVLLGSPVSTATAALAPSAGGEVLPGTTAGGKSNPAAPGVTQASAGDPVNTENGDFTQDNTDVSLPGFGPSLGFTRNYDASVAEQQTQAGTPGAMGYGWTDNYASSLSTGKAVPGYIYTVDGRDTWDGNGWVATSQALWQPGAVVVYNGDTYIADTKEHRIEEVAGATETEWGISMTAGHMYTIAGSEYGISSGDSANGTAMGSSLLNAPQGIAVNSTGLYIADTGNCRVAEIPWSSGTQWGISMTADDLYTIAGVAGSCGTGADKAAATSSDLAAPAGLSFGAGVSAHGLFIADSGNNRIQELAGATGTEYGQSMTADDIYTVMGSAAGTSGDTAPGSAATSTLMNAPLGVSVDGVGGVYAADTSNCRVLLEPISTGTYWSQAMTLYHAYDLDGVSGTCGTGGDGKLGTASDASYPAGVWAGDSNLYIADTGNNRIQEVAGGTHTQFGQSMTASYVYTVAGSSAGTAGSSGDGGAATSAKLDLPQAVWIVSGNVYIADSSGNRVREVSSSTYVISALAGTGGTRYTETSGPAVRDGVYAPEDTAMDSNGDVFIADTGSNRIEEIAASAHTQFGIAMTAGDAYTVAGSTIGTSGLAGDGGAATSALLNQPSGVAVDSSGNLYIADWGNNRVQEVAASTGHISTFAGSSSGTHGYTGDGGAATSALLYEPSQLAADASGNLYILDAANNRVQEVAAATGTQHGISMTKGDIYTIAGSSTGTKGYSGIGGPATSADLQEMVGVGVDSAGDVYTTDAVDCVILEVAASTSTQRGISMTANHIYVVAGNTSLAYAHSGNGGPATSAALNFPEGISVDSSGDLYIADTDNSRIQEVAAANGTQWGQSMTAGDIYTVAGSSSGSSGDSGDGGKATSAKLYYPVSVTVDAKGDLFFPDEVNNLIREVVSTVNSPFAVWPSGTANVAATVTQGDGSQVTFYPQLSGGGCTAPYITAGQYCAQPEFIAATLTSNSGTSWTYTPAAGGETYTYSWSGQLTSIKDPAGNTLTVTYLTPAPGSGGCPSTATSCETATAASGRTLVIGSNSSGLVTSVTDPMGRTWTYGYNSGSQLVTAKSPMGNVTSYTYGQGSTGNPLLASDLLTMTDPNGQPGGPDAGADTVNVYDASGRVTSQTDPMGHVTTFSYCVSGADGNCFDPATGSGNVTITSAGGNVTVDAYTEGVLTAETAWNGSTPSERDFGPALTMAGSSAGTLLDAWQSDAGGNQTSFTYDQAGHLTSITDPLSDTTTTTSTSFGGASCSADPTAASPCSSSQTGPVPVAPGGVITPPSSAPPPGVSYTLYDTIGHALYESTGVYPPGSTTASSVQTTYILYYGNSVMLNGTTVTCAAVPPSPSLPCAQIDASGMVTQIRYDPAGDVTSESTPDGNGSELATVTYGYDGDGEQTSATSADGNLPSANAANFTTLTDYNNDGQATSVTKGDAATGATVTPRTTIYGYDPSGNQTTVQDARGYTTTTTYDADNEKVMVADPLGNASLTCYDGMGDVVQTVPPAGVAAGHLTPSSCPTSYPSGYGDRLAADATTYTFDTSGKETSSTSPAPAGQTGFETTSTTYNAEGLPVQVTGPPDSVGGPNQVTVKSYNANGQLTSETTGYGTSVASTVSYCYDPNGKQTSVVSADGNTGGTAPCETSSPWVVSASSYPTQAAYQTTSSYDSTGQLLSTTAPATAAAPSGATTTFTYDTNGDLLTSKDPNGVTTTRTYTTPGGHIATISYSGSAAPPVSYTYDAQGTMTGMTDATGTSSYTPDPFGELTSVTNGAQQTVGYTYNPDGEVASITYPLPASATWAANPTVTYGYDNADTLTSLTDFTGNKSTITPPSGASTQVSETLGSTGDTVTTSVASNGSPSLISMAQSGTTLQSFTYSDAPDGEILSETDVPSSASSPASYSYDPQGRIASMTPGSGAMLNYGFDAAGNLTTLPTGATGTYDNAGELASAAQSGTTTTSYAYNADGQRLTATQGSATIAAGTWNGAGRLTSYNGPAADMTAATYDGNGLRASATTGSGTQNFVWGDGSRLLMDSSNAYIYTTGYAPAEQVSLSTGTVSYLSTDALGSVRGIIGSTGTLTASTSYDAWGNPLTTGGLTSYTPFGYAGGYTDPTGLLYLINRYYDPGTGQFLSVDPAASQTGQPYGYAGGNPVNAADPSGLWSVAMVSNQSPFSSEFDFRDLWVGPMLGLGGDTSKEYRFEVRGMADRIVDLYFSDNSNFGWLNELKIGPQSAGSVNTSELFRDRILIELPRNFVCHPATNGLGGRPCQHLPIDGGTWWFRYDWRECQRNVFDLLYPGTGLCPFLPLRNDILHNIPRLNIVYVWFTPYRQYDYSYVSARRRANTRNAFESNANPNNVLVSSGAKVLPV